MLISSKDSAEKKFLLKQALQSVMYKKGDVYLFSIQEEYPFNQYLTNGVSLQEPFSLDIPFEINGKSITISEVKNYLAYIFETKEKEVWIHYDEEGNLRRTVWKGSKILEEKMFFVPQMCNEETTIECMKAVKASHLNPVPLNEYKSTYKMEHLTKSMMLLCNPDNKESLS